MLLHFTNGVTISAKYLPSVGLGQFFQRRAMGKCRVESFCFCLSLKTGCYISAFYSAIYYVSSLLIIAQHFSDNAELSNAFMDVPTTLNWLLMVISIIGLFSMGPLIIGLIRESSGLLALWLVVMSADVAIEVIYLTYLTGLLSKSEVGRMFAILIAIDYAIWAFNVHCLLCVLSQYNKFKFANNATSGNLQSAKKVILAYKSSTTSDNIELDSV